MDKMKCFSRLMIFKPPRELLYIMWSTQINYNSWLSNLFIAHLLNNNVVYNKCVLGHQVALKKPLMCCCCYFRFTSCFKLNFWCFYAMESHCCFLQCSFLSCYFHPKLTLSMKMNTKKRNFDSICGAFMLWDAWNVCKKVVEIVYMYFNSNISKQLLLYHKYFLLTR